MDRETEIILMKRVSMETSNTTDFQAIIYLLPHNLIDVWFLCVLHSIFLSYFTNLWFGMSLVFCEMWPKNK